MFRLRSNYFAVQDTQAFEDFCEEHGLEFITNDENASLVGFVSQNEEQPYIFTDEGNIADADPEETSDLFRELFPLIADNHVAVIIHVGSDKLRFLLGYSWAVNNKEQVRRVDLDTIYEKATLLGTEPITRAEY